MTKSKGFMPLLIPSATVFFSSFCIMVLELVASRLIARHLGSSLYTWTAVIGVVLAGITIGNYIGGRIADKFKVRKALAVLFILSSAACVITVISNNLVGGWLWLWQFSWPVRTFSHVSLVFLLPSVLLGTISPVVAKMALDKGLATGRTVGDIYAWGAAGSIAGTFAAGYFLIAAMGTIAIIWTVGGALLVMGLLYWGRLWPGYIWALIFLCALLLAVLPVEWCEKAAAAVALREKPDPDILYEDESQYCYITVRQLSQNPDKRAFEQDKLMHSEIIMGDVSDLQYSYEQIHAAITHRFSGDKKKLSVLVIGGGGYVFPRYVEKVWPGSRVDVAEIDPGVTEAAMHAFGLDRNTSINTISMDARNHVDELLKNEDSAGCYDFIYEDALNDYSVPYQLTTKEFNDKLAILLGDNGVYMVELIDVFDEALFLGSFVNTLEQTFPYVYVITEAHQPNSARNTFVVVGAMRQLNLDNLEKDYKKTALDLWLFDDSDIGSIKQKANYFVLTDDHAPVENFMAPVVRKSAQEILASRYIGEAGKLQKQGRLDEAITLYKKILKMKNTPSPLSIKAYNDIALILATQGKTQQAVETFRNAIEFNEKSDFKSNMANIHFSLGIALKELGNTEQAMPHFDLAIVQYKKKLEKEPKSFKILVRLGNIFAEKAQFAEAAVYFQKAASIDPTILQNHFNLIRATQFAGQIDIAIEHTNRAIRFFTRHNQAQAVGRLKKLLDTLKFQKFQQSQKAN